MPGIYSLIFFISSLFAPLGADAAFTSNLSFRGAQSPAEVKELQQFLKDQGLFAEEVSGNFYTKTYLALVAFQKKEGITPASGYFGPLTRARANTILAGDTSGDFIADSVTTQTASAYSASSSSRASILAQIDKLWAELRSRNKTKDVAVSTAPAATTPAAPASSSGSTTATATTKKPASTTTTTTTTTTTAPAPAPAASASGIAWGAYTGDTMSSLTSLESAVGKTASIQAIFWGWDDTFPASFNLPSGKTLLIYWDPAVNYDAINSGNYDSYIASFAKGAATYAKSHNVILVPFSEMNLSEEVWGDTGANTPAKFVAAWKRVHDIFAQNGALSVKFGLAYNNESTGAHKNFDDYYPGSSYVDYVGVDGFNFGNPWQTPSQVFSTAMAKAASYGKPLYIFATASASGSQKAAWITALGTYAKSVSNLRGVVWFNENKEENWLINSDAASIAAFKAAF